MKTSMMEKIITRLREGILREIWHETKWIYGYTSRYRGSIALYILLGLLSAAVGLASGVASKHLIDAVIGRDSALLGVLIGFYIGFALARIGLGALIKYVGAKVSIRAQNEIREDVFRRFLDMDWQASLAFHSGDLLSRVSGDVSTVAGSVLGWIPSAITTGVQFLGALAVILYYDPVMALLALVGAPVSALLSWRFLPKMRSFNKEVRQRQAELTAFYEESLQNLQAVKALHIKGSMTERLGRLQDMYRDVSLDYSRFSVKTGMAMSGAGFAVSCMCLLWCVWRLWNGVITMGTLVLFLQMANMVSGAFSALVGLVPAVISATVAARRVMTILDLPQEDDRETPETTRLREAAGNQGVAVVAEKVSFSYQDGRRVFSDLTLRAEPGQVVGIVSPSGGGKTTLMRLLLSLISPEEGSLYLRSGDVQADVRPALRRLMTCVSQEKAILARDIASYLRIGQPEISEEDMEKALRRACAWDFVSALPEGLYAPLGERGSGLSEGQLQRLAIARAILSPAPILLMDEATSALDMDTERQVIQNLFEEDSRRTVIVTTHRPSLLAYCHRVYAIEDGVSRCLTAEEIQSRL